MIKRRSIRHKKIPDTYITVIQVLREPRDEDVKNLGFRRAVDLTDEPDSEQLDDDVDGDTLMRDLEVDMLEYAEVETDTRISTNHAIDDSDRIPPQWMPDRFLANIVFDAVELGGDVGLDSEALRERIVGPFWRRPMESYFTRVADDWEKTQPFHLRHLAVLRDQGVTDDKKFLHYIYRTFVHFQKAVDRKAATWNGARRPKPKKAATTPVKDEPLNVWGFPVITPKDLFRGDGAATLSEAGSVIVKPRKYGPRWDNALAQERGYRNVELPRTVKHAVGRPKKQPKPQKDPPVRVPKPPRPPKKAVFSLTDQEKVSMGLQPNTRLSKEIIAQVLAHREKTGDPTSLPDQIIGYQRARPQLSVPLITKADRIAAGIHARGRLGTDKENEIRKQRGLPLLEKKAKKKVTKATKEETVLSKQQRIALGWTAHGRLPQDIINGLRKEREDGVELDDSRVIAKYMDIMKAKKAEADAKEQAKGTKKSAKATEAHASPGTDDDTLDENPDGDYEPAVPEDEAQTPPSQVTLGKRKAEDTVSTSIRAKKRRGRPSTLQEPSLTPTRLRSPSSTEIADVPEESTRLVSPDEDRMEDVTPTTTVEATRRAQPTPPPAEDPIAPSVEVERPPAPVGKVYVQPDASQLDARSRKTLKSYENRSSPGLYLNPTAKQKVPRGRPRKALMATFKLPHLAGLDWFANDRDEIHNTPSNRSTEAFESTRTSGVQPVEESVVEPAEDQAVSRKSSIAEAQRRSSLHLQETTVVEIRDEPRDATLLSPAATKQSTMEIESQNDVRDASLVPHSTIAKAITEPPHSARVATPLSAPASNEQIDEVEPQTDASDGDLLPRTTTEDVGMEIRRDVRDASPLFATANNDSVIETETTPPVSEANAEGAAAPLSPSKNSDHRSDPDSTALGETSASNEYQDHAVSEALAPALSPIKSAGPDSIPTLIAVAVVDAASLSEQLLPTVASEAPDEPSPRETAPVPRMIGGWAPINAYQDYRATPYRSPYAAVPAQTADAVVASEGSVLPDITTQSPTAGANNEIPLHGGFYSALTETAPPEERGTIKPKDKLCANRGSGEEFRHKIILEIIDRCHGVFPGGREIVRPFYALWRERHQSIKAPVESTIISTIKDMARSTEFGLKHWTMALPKRSSAGLRYKYMYTRVGMTQNSPEVKKLAYSMSRMTYKQGHQYIPEEICDLVGDTKAYVRTIPPPIDESIVLPRPPLEQHIVEAKKRRRSELNKKYHLERRARKQQDLLVQQGLGPSTLTTETGARAKRTRLASLNDKNKRIRQRPVQTDMDGSSDEEEDEEETSDIEFAGATNSGPTPLIWMPPIVGPALEREAVPVEDKEQADPSALGAEKHPDALSAAPIETAATTDGTVAQSESIDTGKGAPTASTETPTEQPAAVPKTKKRVRIVTPRDQSSRKRARIIPVSAAPTQDSSADDDAPYASEEEHEEYDEEEDDTDDQASHTKAKKPKSRAYKGRQKGRRGPPPTLLERLTGLTGDPNDPIYQPPDRTPRPGSYSRSWSEGKKKQVNKFKKQRTYAEDVDPVDNFKKLFCTFVVASSISAEDDQVDWSIVKKVHDSDKFFDEAKAQKLWAWMQTNMVEEVGELTTNFQSIFLEAYEAGKVAAIEEPDNYDWAELVRWTMRKCTYPELPLPILREALQQFAVDESKYETLDRIAWYKANTADRTRSLLQLQHTFTAPLHRRREAKWSPEDKLLKARSWIRSNNATSQTQYDAGSAHEKFKELGESVLVNVVGDLVDKKHLRMRKLKRQLPGRNYTFTKALAKKYVRQFQLDDFMEAVHVKKKMDAAFASHDPAQRVYNISRCEEDTSVAAIMTMVNEGTVKLLPQLPSVNSEFGAPLPRLSVWGFCEGDYIHRAIDRGRLFWDIHVIPTEYYKFGNPLQSLQSPPLPDDSGELAVWPALPDPPLPGKYDAGAPLPIWSNIDGQTVTWPWWYRVLNIVLQPLIFLAGATAADIHSHCPEHTTELFEVELVLYWLESVNAVKKTIGGGYITLPGFWATFGDKLHDTEDDDFGEHVKRKVKPTDRQLWRGDYNLRHSTLQARTAVQQTQAVNVEENGDATMTDAGAVDPSMTQQILKNPKQQYGIIQQVLVAQQSQSQEERGRSGSAATASPPPVQEQTQQAPAMNVARASGSQTPETTSTSGEDVVMTDADVDAEGEDIDAEGEIDDSMY
jgi:hypothetical protein